MPIFSARSVRSSGGGSRPTSLPLMRISPALGEAFLISAIRPQRALHAHHRNPDAQCDEDASGQAPVRGQRRPEMGQQLRAMARKFGLDPHDITADRWQALDISLACATCKKAGACANFLTDRGSFSLSECANAPTYAALAEAKYPAS